MRIILTLTALCGALIGSFFIESKEPRAELTGGYVSIETLDPQIARANEDIRIAYALFEGLCTFNPYTFQVIPGVAESWELSEDRTTYTFHIRSDARWSTGEPIRASDFTYSWRMGLMPDTVAPYIEFLQFMKGGKAFTDWCIASMQAINDMPATNEAEKLARLEAAKLRAEDSIKKFDEYVEVKVVDDRTLIVQVERPTPYFLEMMASWPYFPVHPPTIQKITYLNPESLMLRREPYWTEPYRINADGEAEGMVNNGPYLLQSQKFNNFIRLKANPNYWAKDNVNPQTVELLRFPDTKTWFNAYSTGLVDIVFDAQNLGITPDLLKQSKEGTRKDIVKHVGFSTYYYCFNTRPTLPGGQPNPFTNKEVRRAFVMSLDKVAIVEEIKRAGQRSATTIVPIGSVPGYDSPEGIAHDPVGAKKVLADAGYPNGQGLPVIELSYNSGADHEPVAQAAARMWETALGVKTTQEAQEWKVFLANRIKGDFVICRHAWTGDYADPTTFLDLFRSGNGNNDAGFSDPHYDKLLDNAANEHDPAKRMALLKEAERYLVYDQAALCPVYFYVVVHIEREGVTGISEHPRDLQFFHLMKVAKTP